MADALPTTRWRWLRRAFRWCRIGLLVLLLALVLGVLYFHRVGLPGFLKTALRSELLRRGADLRFDRLAWHWYRGFVLEEATLRATGSAPGPRVNATEIALNLDWDRLLREGQVGIESVRILGGRLVVPLQEPGELPDECSLEDVGAAIRFLPNGQWVIEDVQATFLGATFYAGGTITHADAGARAPAAKPPVRRPDPLAVVRPVVRQVVGTWRRLHFAMPPEVRLRFEGDALHPASFAVTLRGQARGARTPWFSARTLRWLMELTPRPGSEGDALLSVHLDADGARTPRGNLQRASLTARAVSSLTNPAPSSVDWELGLQQVRAGQVELAAARASGHSERLRDDGSAWRTSLTLAAGGLDSAWGSLGTNRCSTTIEHSLSSVLSSHVDLAAEAGKLDSRWGKTESLKLSARLHHETNRLSLADPGWGFWTRLAPFSAAWDLSLTNFQSPRLALDRITLAGGWTAPVLTVSNLHGRLYGGTFDLAEARLEVDTRAVEARFGSAFDAHAVAPLLGRGAAEWLEQFRWSRPPEVSAVVKARLPAWTNREPDWARGVLPSVVVEARVRGENAEYREVQVQEARLAVTFSNRVLRLRDFHLVRPEGDADLAYDLDTVSQQFRWRLRTNLDPKGVGPAIDDDAPRVLSLFEFRGPAAVAGEVWGRWGPDKELNLALAGCVTNFTFRGEPVDELLAGVFLTNQFLLATNVSVRLGSEWARAGAVGVDFPQAWLYLTNADAEVAPPRFARMIGSNLVNTLSPYRFDRPPRVQVDGRVPIQGRLDEADMRFSVVGGPFHFWRFNSPEVSARVHWEGDRVSITNAVCKFYDGQLQGHLRANLLANGSAELAFRTAVTNVSLQSLVLDTIPTTNRIEGNLQGVLNVTRANSADWKSWNGSGRLVMRDGLLWDLPVFSVLSPALNAIAPGLGNSRARAATGSFTITNSVFRTEDLEIVAQPVRLAYRGTLDFDWNIRAQVEAEILPGAPLIGPILNILLAPVSKALIYKVSGTLGTPQLEPLLVPKFLLPVVRPFQTIRGLFSSPSPAPGTNTPPKTAP